jgi:hypothetical protein
MKALMASDQRQFLESRRHHGSRRLVVEALEGRMLLSANPTSVSVAVSTPSLFYGAPETLTATVSVPTDVPAPSEGSVTFYDGTTPLSTSPVNLGLATYTTNNLGVGPHTITAAYTGDNNYASSTSGVEPSSTQSVLPVTVSSPYDVAVDSKGDVFVADSNDHRVIELAKNGTQTTIASGFSNPLGIAVDSAGDVFVVDSSQVVEIPYPYTSGPETVISGLADPFDVAVNAAGNEVFATDGFNDQVVEVNSGTQSTIASPFDFPEGVAVDSAGDVFIAQANSSSILEVIAGGGQTTVGSGLSFPLGMAVDAAGDLFIDDSGNNRVVEVAASGTQTTVGSGLSSPTGVAVDSSGDVFIAEQPSNQVLKVTAGLPVTVNQDPTSTSVAASSVTTYIGQSATFTATVSVPTGSMPAGAGSVTFYDGMTQLDTVNVSGGVAVFSTTALALGSHTITASYNGAPGYAASTSGTSASMTVTPIATSTTLSASSTSTIFGQFDTFTATISVPPGFMAPGAGAGNVTFFDGLTSLGNEPVSAAGVATFTTSTLGLGSHNIVAQYSGTTDFAASTSGVTPTSGQSVLAISNLGDPRGLAVDGMGDLFVADDKNNQVIEVPRTGSPSIVASGLSSPSGVAIDGMNDVFIANSGGNQVLELTSSVSSIFDGNLTNPKGVAVDAMGNVFIADTGANQVLELTVATQITIASGLSAPADVAVDAAGDIYIADTGNNRVLEITPTGAQKTVGFGLVSPVGVAVDAVGDVFIASSGNNQVVEVTPTGIQIAFGSVLSNPTGVAVDGTGDVFISDSSNDRVVKVTPGLPVTVSAAAPSLTWTKPADIAYGTPLGTTQLDASASVPGTFSYNPPLETILHAGSDQSLSVTFTPTDSTDYTAATATVAINVDQVAPTVSWTIPADITYGTPLGTVQLDASASVPGILSYSPPLGTILHAGLDQSLSVTFTPTDSTDYTSATATVAINVDRAIPTLAWTKPGDIIAGTAVGIAELDATSNVPGTFAYTPTAGTVLPLGQGQTLSVTFTPTDSIDYTTAAATVAINVDQFASSVSWTKPADITYGTPLGTAQLDASASVPGTFSYSPPLGTVLHAGLDQSLSVTFTPTDSTDYTSATATVAINVDQATPIITWIAPANMIAGTALGAAQLDATANVPGTFIYTPATGTVLPTGQGEVLSVTFTPTDTNDFNTVTASTTINVLASPSPPLIIGEQALFQRKLKRGKPTGQPVLVGYMIDFSSRLDASSANRGANYQVDTPVTKKVKKHKVTTLQPLTGFTVSYNDASESVSLLFTNQQTFKTGGLITVLGGPSNGVTGLSGAFVAGNTVLAISPGGKNIAPA